MEPPPWLPSLMSTDAAALFFLPIILTNYVFLKTEANHFLVKGSSVTDNRLVNKHFEYTNSEKNSNAYLEHTCESLWVSLR